MGEFVGWRVLLVGDEWGYINRPEIFSWNALRNRDGGGLRRQEIASCRRGTQLRRKCASKTQYCGRMGNRTPVGSWEA